jgi:uncharacterized protein YyaL (SSP411 family)
MASRLAEYVIDYFREEETSFFYYTNKEQYDVIIRKREVYDGATPSGNAVMGHNLLYLSVVFDRKEWRSRAEDMAASLGQVIVKYPASFGVWASLLQSLVRGVPEVVATAQKIVEWRKQILSIFIPYRIFQSTDRPDNRFPLLEGKQIESQPLVFLCRNYACHHPEDNLSDFVRLLETE